MEPIGNMMTCPLDKNHRMKSTRFLKHLKICQKKYPNVQLFHCVFDYTHVLTNCHDMQQHLMVCPYRRMIKTPLCDRNPSILNSDLNNDFMDRESLIVSPTASELDTEDELAAIKWCSTVPVLCEQHKIRVDSPDCSNIANETKATIALSYSPDVNKKTIVPTVSKSEMFSTSSEKSVLSAKSSSIIATENYITRRGAVDPNKTCKDATSVGNGEISKEGATALDLTAEEHIGVLGAWAIDDWDPPDWWDFGEEPPKVRKPLKPRTELRDHIDQIDWIEFSTYFLDLERKEEKEDWESY